MEIRSLLLDEMVSAPKAALPGPVNGVVLNAIALCLNAGTMFVAFMIAEVALLALRMCLMRRASRDRARGRPTPPDLYLIVAASWCALEGAMGFAAMASGIVPLQVLFATSVMALTGPICARNYGAPRYAMLLLGLCVLPLIAGAQFVSNPWLTLMMPQTVLLFMGAGAVVKRFHTLSVSALLAQAHSTHRAAHDSLTGLLNRAGLADTLLERDVTRRPHAVFYVDLDGFKPVNDTFGHRAGDLMLVAVAGRLRACARSSDIVARLGGDEFVLITPDMTPAESECFAERIVAHISAQPYMLDSFGKLRVGASVGYACGPQDGVDFAELQRKADAALYDAKAAGRGTFRRFAELDSARSLAADPYVVSE